LEEVESGLIPKNHLEILSTAKREKKGWMEERSRKIYIKAAKTLAFRKMQVRNSSGASRVFYEKDIQNYRSFIYNLLYNVQV